MTTYRAVTQITADHLKCTFLSLFEPMEGSVVAESSSKKLNVKLIAEMVNEILNLNTRQNERILDAFILQHDIEFDGVEEDLSDNEMKEN